MSVLPFIVNVFIQSVLMRYPPDNFRTTPLGIEQYAKTQIHLFKTNFQILGTLGYFTLTFFMRNVFVVLTSL